METNGYAHNKEKSMRDNWRLRETKETKESACGDQWRCTPVKGGNLETVNDRWRLQRLETLWKPMENIAHHCRKKSKRQLETEETGETVETNGDAHQ